VIQVSDSEAILQALRQIKPKLERDYSLTRMALFGSAARNDAGPDSDVDILVDVEPSIGLRFIDLADELEQTLGRKVDLVSSRAVKPKMREQIETELRYV